MGQNLQLLSFFDLFRFCRYLSEIDQRTENIAKEKRDGIILSPLRRRRFGGILNDKEIYIMSLSDYSLSDTEKFVLSNGLEFFLSPKSGKMVFSRIYNAILLYAQLARQKKISSNKLSSLEAKRSGLAHAYCGTPVELVDFNMHIEYFQAIKILFCHFKQK